MMTQVSIPLQSKDWMADVRDFERESYSPIQNAGLHVFTPDNDFIDWIVHRADSPELESIEISSTWRPLSIVEYQQLIPNGVIPEGAPIELLGGMLVWKDRRDNAGDIMTIGQLHTIVLGDLHELLVEVARGQNVHVRNQAPATTSGDGQPEPDIAIAIGNRRQYPISDPGPGDILFVAEIADSSLRLDRQVKLPKYARAGVPEYWIVNLHEMNVEVYRGPLPSVGRYQDKQVYERGSIVELNLVEVTHPIQVDDFLTD